MRTIKIIIAVVVVLQTVLAADKVMVGSFSNGEMTGWEAKKFKAVTRYQLVKQDYTQVLKAESEHAASGLVKKTRIDLSLTPFLNWRWKVEKGLDRLDEQVKSGDDYAARIYIIVSGGWVFWKTRAINYVWSSNQQKGSVWANAFVGKNAMMLALRNQHDETGVWYEEKRNIHADLKQLFGEDIQFIDAVAIMTDTDNSGGHAISYYGDIFFSTD